MITTEETVNIQQVANVEKHELVRVFVKGGVISAGDLLKIIHTVEGFGLDYIHFGSRQDIMFPASSNVRNIIDETFNAIHTSYDMDGESYQNIVSSYPALNVMPKRQWLATHIYHYIFETFDYQPKLKINIVDPTQSLVPLFTGNLNFIASQKESYWYMFIRLENIDEKPWQVPILIYSYDIAKTSKAIEEALQNKKFDNYQELFNEVISPLKINAQAAKESLVYPDTNFPYYEGINLSEDGHYWLGLYWRNNCFSIKFLKALCELCQETKVGKLCLTPWKSFIIQGINESDKLLWEKLLGKYGINMRHSAIELNWHLPVLDQEALELKTFLVRALDQQDISTYGLSFTIRNTQDIILFTSVVIEKNEERSGKSPTYNVLYSKDFNPNLTEYTAYAKGVTKEVLPPILIELSKRYYEQLETRSTPTGSKRSKKTGEKVLYQCTNCMTVYDDAFGEPDTGIEPGIPFGKLPESYTCPTCSSPKSSFMPLG
ncbi:rubredoxin [Flammeovirgaceae bacterium SG7u.111]|nr:rubredoxin [Flammeovirgaceae bacterium SG7u.132]WPO33430.1 rubredoxin [Flammeovirgaceae bacterium SG7u.111]